MPKLQRYAMKESKPIVNGRYMFRVSGLVRIAALSLLSVTSFGSGCIDGTLGEPGASCESTRAYFLRDVWGPVLATKCVGCHTPGGQAEGRGARFILLPASYPDFADANLASVVAMVNQSYTTGSGQTAALLAKPLARVQHGGGAVIHEGSAEHRALEGLVERLQREDDATACRDYGSIAAPSGVVLLDWRQTLRKASLDMLGRLPTEAELLRGGSSEQGFEQTFSSMLEDPAFYQRWRTAWNDLMLTDKYLTNDGCNQPALNLISGDDFPNRGAYGGGASATGLDCCGRDRENPTCADVREFFRRANNAVAQEPINLFEYIVRNDRSFAEILTADYVMVNAASANVYGVNDQVRFESYASNEFLPARITYTWREYRNANNSRELVREERSEYPHAGVLTTPAFLARYPTTETNRNRHRARIVQSYFLGTDILRVGERPLDPTTSEALVQTPTLNYGPCVTCHRTNDPIAGAFRTFPPGNIPGRYRASATWYADMFPPGFGGENMPASSYPTAVRWLAQRVVADPRFAMSVVRFIYTALTGREPLTHPTDPSDPLYGAHAAAWNEQDRALRAIARRFTASNMNFKVALLEMLKSPLYRAVAAVGSNSLAGRTAHAGLGTAMLLTPELLDRRIRAIAGFPWVKTLGRNDSWLLNDFYLPYGGINSDTIVRRATEPSGVITGIAHRMATEVACRATAWDFSFPQDERRFFRYVRIDTVPESGGQPVPGSIAQIRRNIVWLHEAILGERLPIDDPEVTRTYTLFTETWQEVRGSNTLPEPCRAESSPVDGTRLPMERTIVADPNGTVRAWMTVLTYLFSDHRFLYQ